MIKYIRLLSLSILLLFFISSNLFAADVKYDLKTPSQKENVVNPILLTTGDLKEDCEVLGIVSAVTGSTDMDSLQNPIIDRAKLVGADYVIAIRYISHAGALYCYGTAVKIKPKKENKTSGQTSPKTH